MDVISDGLRYKGVNYPKGDVVKGVPDYLAKRWIDMGYAKKLKEHENDINEKLKKDTTNKVVNEKPEDRKDKLENGMIAFNDLEKRKGGHYYLNDEHFAHGKENAKKKISGLNEG